MVKKLLPFLFIIFHLHFFSQSVSQNTAKTCAEYFLSTEINENVSLTLEKTIYVEVNNQQTPAFYIFNNSQTNKFVIISANKLVLPILSYSSSSHFIYDTLSMPIATQLMLTRYTENIEEIVLRNNAVANQANIDEWDKLINQISTGQRSSQVGPLLSTKWGQRAPFNTYTPPNTPTGCNSVVLTQLMKYYRFPQYGRESKTYTNNNITHSINFEDQTYNWSTMPNAPTTSTSTSLTSPIARAMYHAGVAAETDYGIYGSNATVMNLYFAIQKNFAYTTISNTDPITELNNSHPVIGYSSQTYNSNSGHVYLIDGYNSTYNTYHINWGWAGQYDGFYSLSNLNPGSQYDYPYHFSYFEPNYFLGLSSGITVNSSGAVGQPYSVSFGIKNIGKKVYSGHFLVQALDANGLELTQNQTGAISLSPGASNNYTVNMSSYSSAISEIKVSYIVYNTYKKVHKLSFRNPQSHIPNTTQANPCDNITNISCGQTLAGSTYGGTNAFNNYNCASQNEYGKEKIYKFTLTQESHVQAKLTSVSTDLDVHIMSSCDINSCIARGDNTALAYYMQPGTYYIAVDGYGTSSSRAGTFNLTLQCTPTTTSSGGGGSTSNTNPLGSCNNPISINCGETKSGNTAYGTSSINYYDCGSQPEFGRELVYQFILTQTSDVNIQLSNMYYDLDVHLLQSSCDPSSCLGRGDRSVSKYNLPAGTYYIMVDGYGYSTSRTGSFNLSLSCTPSNVVSTGSKGSCLDPLDISCGETKYGNTANGYNHFNNYSCGSQNEYGKDLVYKFTLTQPSDVDMYLSYLSVDLDLQLLEANCASTSCIARSDNRIQYNNLPSGDYFIVVDGYGTNSSLSGSFALTFNCVASSSTNVASTGGTSTNDAIDLYCGEVVQNNTENGSNYYSFYQNCNAYFSGNELIYKIHLQEESDIDLMLNTANDQEVFLMDSTMNCLDRSQNGILNLANQSIGDYFLIVDGPSTGSFTLTFDCVPSASQQIISNNGNDSSTSITGLELGDFSMYPNPTSNYLTIDLSNLNLSNEETNLSVLNMQGKLLYQKEIITISEQIQLSMDELTRAKGIYLIQVISNEKAIRKKLIYH